MANETMAAYLSDYLGLIQAWVDTHIGDKPIPSPKIYEALSKMIAGVLDMAPTTFASAFNANVHLGHIKGIEGVKGRYGGYRKVSGSKIIPGIEKVAAALPKADEKTESEIDQLVTAKSAKAQLRALKKKIAPEPEPDENDEVDEDESSDESDNTATVSTSTHPNKIEKLDDDGNVVDVVSEEKEESPKKHGGRGRAKNGEIPLSKDLKEAADVLQERRDAKRSAEEKGTVTDALNRLRLEPPKKDTHAHAKHVWIGNRLFRVLRTFAELETLVVTVLRGGQNDDGDIVFNGKRWDCSGLGNELFERFLVHCFRAWEDGESEPMLDDGSGISVELRMNDVSEAS